MEKLANKSFTIRIEPEILTELERISEDREWTLSFTIRKVLNEYVPNRDKIQDWLKELEQTANNNA